MLCYAATAAQKTPQVMGNEPMKNRFGDLDFFEQFHNDLFTF
jgi:hypothetical protein